MPKKLLSTRSPIHQDTRLTPDAQFDPLLHPAFAAHWAKPPHSTESASQLKARLWQKILHSKHTEHDKHNVRRNAQALEANDNNVRIQTLYQTPHETPSRYGEPVRSSLIELAPGARLGTELGPDRTRWQREWLVLTGQVKHENLCLSQRDFHLVPEGQIDMAWYSATGATLFLRESVPVKELGSQGLTVLDSQTPWIDFAPGIQRRVLWERGGQAALLYCAQAGAQVPVHSHDHDEECLIVEGELFLDDWLMQFGDYQLAPSGSRHHCTFTDRGAVLFAHGDAQLQFVA